MFENLSERLERSFKILKGEGKITEINVAETLKDVRRALLDADVNYKVAKQFTDTVKTKALGQDVLTAVKPGQLMVKIVHDELATLMGGETAEVNLSQNPSIILMSGLQGSGKTTFSGKLAKMLKSKKGKRPLLVACDVYRPAAIEQLKVLGEQIDVPVYTEEDSKDPVSISANAVKYAKETVGLGTCIPQRYVKSEEKDKDNYLYTITSPGNKYLQYHTTFTSMKETFGYKTPEAWFAYLREWKEELAHPVTVKIKDIH